MSSKSRENEGQEQMRDTLAAQPTADLPQPDQTDEAKARDEAATAEAERLAEAGKRQREADEAAYQASIEGQELPPSVQEAQQG
jgi:cytochrome c1